MTPIIDDPVELRKKGFEALVDALGWVNAVRFIRQYEKGEGDYTAEREQILPGWDTRTLIDKIRSLKRS